MSRQERFDYAVVKAVSVSVNSNLDGYPRLVVEFVVMPSGDEFISQAGVEGILKMAEFGFNMGLLPRSTRKAEEQ